MGKSLFFAAAAGLTLVSASPPQAQEARETRIGYPPCSRTVTDRCIQLNERAARAPENLARNAGTAQAAAPVRQADDIDVTYAGDLRPAGPSSAPAPAPVHAPAQARAEAAPAPAPARPARAHSVRVQDLRQASAAPKAYPACRAGVSDRCQQQRPRTAQRRLSLRVKRAGERG